MRRRDFIVRSTLSGLGLASGFVPFSVLEDHDITRLTILHTNDTHSHIDPFPENDVKYPGQGGVSRRAAVINKIRSVKENILLFL